ncbi:TonB-dependent receptor [Carboxylicivirga sp. N1Y90]|uniref:TonB-dependent receptor n=1 Tax=Carboxylicivirga fragile TaxID=3417571 RepID=UPI003D33BD3C|nr:TonB-dependent receptor [Marinilabiliaceae bacterium N1Y90]
MKLSIFLLIVSMVHISASSYSQSKNLNFTKGHSTLKDVFQEIEQQSSYTIFYKDDQVDLNRVITQDVDVANVDEVLQVALKGTGLTYQINDKLIVIMKDENHIAQQVEKKTIKGKVVDNTGFPLPGVNVFVQGTTNGTITNVDGEFELEINTTDENIVFSFIGFETQVVAAQGKSSFDISLMDEAFGLDEVVAIGFGVQKKSDLTGAVASVKGDKLTKVVASNPAEQLQGRMAGVNITSIGGGPGAGMDIKIRGASTLNNNSPLVIIDNVPGSMFMLNPDDIESMEVLKDGAAAAIYGTEAANGVILITTKRGKEGKMTVNASAKMVVQKQTEQLQMLNSSQYMKVANMMYENTNTSKPQFLSEPYYYDTNWLDAVVRDAPMQEYNVSMSGGSKDIQYYVSGSWLDQKGTIIGSDFKKANIRSKIDFKGEYFDAGINVSYNETDRSNLSMSIKEAYEMMPMIPVFDGSRPDGFGYADDDKGMLSNNNPVGTEHFRDSKSTDQFFSGLGYVTFDIIKGLNFKFEAGLNNSNRHSFLHHPSYNINEKQIVRYPRVYEERSNWREMNINNILNYTKDFGDHSLKLMGAYVVKKETNDWMTANISGFKNVYSAEGDELIITEEPTGFLDESFNTLDAGQDGDSSVGGSRTTYTKTSLLWRLNYSYRGRYLFQATVRRDGSSKFGPDSRYGTFPSFALGWRLTEESFMGSQDWLSNLKVRASYGILGNENSLGLYEHMPLMTSSTGEYLSYSRGGGETVWLGTISRDLENREYRWETTTTMNIGFDFGVINNKLSGSLNYYDNTTTDMLVNKPIPSSAGINTPKVNFGEMVNSGFELELTYQDRVGDLEYTLFGGLSTTKNEVTKLGNDSESIRGVALNYSEHFAHQTRVGGPLGAFYLYQVDGIFQNDKEVSDYNAKGKDGVDILPNAKPGDIRFKDVNGDGVLNDDDKIFSGTGIPKVNYSFSIDAAYKGFDLSILMHGSAGHKIYNGNRYYFEGMRTGRNMFATTANAWTTSNTNTDMPRAAFGDPNGNSRESTRFLEDGDYFRIKTIQLGYTLPRVWTEKIKLQKARFYVSGQNLFTFTNYTGQDPEIGRSDVWSPSLDTALYPISKMYIAGVQITL